MRERVRSETDAMRCAAELPTLLAQRIVVPIAFSSLPLRYGETNPRASSRLHMKKLNVNKVILPIYTFKLQQSFKKRKRIRLVLQLPKSCFSKLKSIKSIILFTFSIFFRFFQNYFLLGCVYFTSYLK